MIAVPAVEWEVYRGLTPKELAKALKELAAAARLTFYPRHRRGPKKPRPPRSRAKNQPHVATARLLAAKEKKAK